MKSTTLLIVGGLGLGAFALFLVFRKKPIPVVNGGLPINSAPGRAYSLGALFSTLGQPNNPIFTPASGVAFLEGALTGGQGASTSAALSSPDSGFFSGSGGSGSGGSGTDVGWQDGDDGESFF